MSLSVCITNPTTLALFEAKDRIGIRFWFDSELATSNQASAYDLDLMQRDIHGFIINETDNSRFHRNSLNPRFACDASLFTSLKSRGLRATHLISEFEDLPNAAVQLRQSVNAGRSNPVILLRYFVAPTLPRWRQIAAVSSIAAPRLGRLDFTSSMGRRGTPVSVNQPYASCASITCAPRVLFEKCSKICELAFDDVKHASTHYPNSIEPLFDLRMAEQFLTKDLFSEFVRELLIEKEKFE